MDVITVSGAYTQYKKAKKDFIKCLKQTADKVGPKNATNRGPVSSSSTVRYTELQGLARSVLSALPPESIPRHIVEMLREVI